MSGESVPTIDGQTVEGIAQSELRQALYLRCLIRAAGDEATRLEALHFDVPLAGSDAIESTRLQANVTITGPAGELNWSAYFTAGPVDGAQT